jgi:hypothetical protein
MTAARAHIAIPLPPTSTWRLLRHESELPDGYVVIGQLTVGRADLPKLNAERSPLRTMFLEELKAAHNGVSLAAWRALLALYVRMNVLQRREVIEYAEKLLEAEAPAASSEPSKRTLCAACPLRQVPAVAQEVRSA